MYRIVLVSFMGLLIIGGAHLLLVKNKPGSFLQESVAKAVPVDVGAVDGPTTGAPLEAGQDNPAKSSKKPALRELGEPRLKEKPIAVLKGHRKGITCLTFSPDSKFLASASQDSSARIWDLSGKKDPLVLKDDGLGFYSVHFSPTGKLVMTASQGKGLGHPDYLRLWDASTGKQLKVFSLLGSPCGARFTPDGKYVAVLGEGAKDKPMPYGVIFCNIETGKPEHEFLGHKWAAKTFAISGDGALVASGGPDKLVKVWDVKNRKELLSISPGMEEISSLAFSPDIGVLAIGSDRNLEQVMMGRNPPDVKLYDLKKRAEMNYVRPFGGIVDEIVFCPDRPCLAVAAGSGITLVNLNNGALLVIEDEDLGPASAITFSQDGRFFAAGGGAGNITVWKTVLPDFK
jgi:WD40 repeat protein